MKRKGEIRCLRSRDRARSGKALDDGERFDTPSPDDEERDGNYDDEQPHD